MKILTFRTALVLIAVSAVLGLTFASSAQDQSEPTAVLIKSNSPLVAQKLADAVEKSQFRKNEYRLNLPQRFKMKGARVRGSLPASQIVQLERQVKLNNRNFGKGSGDIIILVKVITKGSIAEKLVRDALQGVDQSLYQMEVVRR
jgi:hypothetical protein